jgi:hypothetical protein
VAGGITHSLFGTSEELPGLERRVLGSVGWEAAADGSEGGHEALETARNRR